MNAPCEKHKGMGCQAACPGCVLERLAAVERGLRQMTEQMQRLETVTTSQYNAGFRAAGDWVMERYSGEPLTDVAEDIHDEADRREGKA